MNCYLEQLEKQILLSSSGSNLKRMLQTRFYTAFRNTKITYADAADSHLLLTSMGFNFLEALYHLCGEWIIDCGLLSKETIIFMKKHLENIENEDPAERKINKIIQELDDLLVFYYLKKDTERLYKVSTRINEATKGSRV